MYKDIVNSLLPADDLHWCEEDKKYISLSKEEIDEIVSSCWKQGIKELKDVYKVIEWCGRMRVGNLLWKNFVSGAILISFLDENGEPNFTTRKEDNEN